MASDRTREPYSRAEVPVLAHNDRHLVGGFVRQLGQVNGEADVNALLLATLANAAPTARLHPAHVRENVFDSDTGDHRLIPQGLRSLVTQDVIFPGPCQEASR